MADVPAGEVVLGNDPRPAGGPAAPDEAPRHVVSVAAVSLSSMPVTNAQYRAFVLDTGRSPPPHWPGGSIPTELAEHPVTHVDWHDATAFCAWAGGRLPTEAEWEKAARGTDGRVFPWGDDEPEPEDPMPGHELPGRATFGVGAKSGRTTVVGAHPDGAGPYGLLDMAGNVWEWVSSVYAPYPYDPDDGREDPSSGLPRVLRGGSFASPTLAQPALRRAEPERTGPALAAHRLPHRPRRQRMIERVDADRLRDLTLELVAVESPTGDTAEVARLFARRLTEIGLEVEVLDDGVPGDADRDRPPPRRGAGADRRARRAPRHGADRARSTPASRTASSTAVVPQT